MLWETLYRALAVHGNVKQGIQKVAVVMRPFRDAASEHREARPNTSDIVQLRNFVACVFCAMQDWSENRARVHLTGPRCTMPNPTAVAELWSANWYAEQFPFYFSAGVRSLSCGFPTS